jgi:hypothetical protein
MKAHYPPMNDRTRKGLFQLKPRQGKKTGLNNAVKEQFKRTRASNKIPDVEPTIDPKMNSSTNFTCLESLERPRKRELLRALSGDVDSL